MYTIIGFIVVAILAFIVGKWRGAWDARATATRWANKAYGDPKRYSFNDFTQAVCDADTGEDQMDISEASTAVSTTFKTMSRMSNKEVILRLDKYRDNTGDVPPPYDLD